MSRRTIAVGPDAVRGSLVILSAAYSGKIASGAISTGTQWRGDRMLLSVDPNHARFVAGSTLYSQDRVGFMQTELPAGGAPPRQASWLRGLSPYEAVFFFSLAGELVERWPDLLTTCAFLDRFGHFYASQRTHLALAAREAHFIAEGLMDFERWPALFEGLLNAMGNPEPSFVPKGVSDADLGAFVGKLLIGTRGGRTPLDRIPECLRAMREPPAPFVEECLRTPHNLRMWDKLERAAESAAPLIKRLREAL